MAPARLAAAALALVLLGLFPIGGLDLAIEDRLIFFPERSLVATPAALGIPFEDVRFGPDGRLHGWFIPGSSPGLSGVTLLWFHGNAGNVSHRVELLERLHHGLGVGIFIFDYGGYGQSAGRPSEQETYQNAREALAYLRSRPDVAADQIVYYGKSLGGAVAAELAAAEPPYRLIVQSSFTTIKDMARLHYPYLPFGALLRTRFSTLDRIGAVTAPLLVIHGDKDEIVPPEQGRRLYEAASEPKRLYVVPGAGHNDVIPVGGRAYLDVLRNFIHAANGS